MTLRFVVSLLKPQAQAHKCLLIRRAHEEKSVTVFNSFAYLKEKNKKSYIEMVKLFEGNDPRRRNHCEFIAAALPYMEEFNVHKDLEVYKALMSVLPKGRFVPRNIIQSEFMHYPKQQQVALQVLEQMEDFGVMPDSEMQDILFNTFGKRGFPTRKFYRMMYWMPKFKNLSPWPVPDTLPQDTLELAKLAVKRITDVDYGMEISVFKTVDVEDSIDDTWIVSAQCPLQKKLIQKETEERLKELDEVTRQKTRENDKQDVKSEESNVSNDNDSEQQEQINTISPREPLKVHGPYQVYLKDQVVQYFTLTGPVFHEEPDDQDPDDITQLEIISPFGSSSIPAISSDVHEQDDGTVLAVCATGSSTRDSLLSWIRLLEKNGNPDLANLPVVFSLSSPPSGLVVKVTEPEVGG